MFKGIVIGQYYPVDSPIHALDPRTKVSLMVAFIILLFLAGNAMSMVLMGIFSVLTILLSRVPLKLMVRTFRAVLYILILTMALHIFTTPGTRAFQLGPLVGTYEGIRQGMFLSIRLIILIGTTSLLTLTTSPIALTDGLESLLSPLQRIGVPAHELAMMMTIALRFIPTLMEEADKIMKAQMARGADFESGNVFQRAKSLVPLLVPLFVSAFRRADELAMAMESRCYRGSEKRTRLVQLRMGLGDYVAMAVVCALGVAVIWLRRV
ncbi:MAG TPA: energy-coupling factor transporter transmembrane protein EcfT [Firmicutes bacterium]|nr:energy-coupling factor transporter transmembrane protein EcfT [Bacillota bacterium]